MTKLLLATPNPLDEYELTELTEMEYTVQTASPFGPPLAGLSDAEVVVGLGHFIDQNLAAFPVLKMIQLCSAGFDRVPLQKIRERGIVLCNARGVYSIPVAEWVLLKALEICKDTRYFTDMQSRATWQMKRDLLELSGKTIGIIGTGSIGTEVAKRAAAFGCSVIGLNTRGDIREFFTACFAAEQLAEFLAGSDIVVVTLPYSEKSHHLLNRETLRHMRDDAILINIARGGIIEENDLLETLESGKFRGVALDVLAEEPLPKESPLWKHERVLITPHNSFASDGIEKRLTALIMANLRAYQHGQPLSNIV